jgi:hypothetical protein
MVGMIPISARMLAGVSLAASLTVSAASAQQAQPSNIRGSIESVDGAVLNIKARNGGERKVRMSDNVMVTGIAKAALSDIKSGDYVGVTGMPQADGTQKAIAIHIFPESMRGLAEGSRPWDLRANSSMTNATVDQKVEAKDGQTLTVKYKDGEKKVTVEPNTPIVTFVPGSKDELKPGVQVIIVGAKKAADGSFETARVNVGRGGLTPPM